MGHDRKKQISLVKAIEIKKTATQTVSYNSQNIELVIVAN